MPVEPIKVRILLMIKIAPAGEVNSLDALMRERYGLPSETLIEKASSLMYIDIRDMISNRRTLFLVGKGNNGSDALSVALYAKADGLDVSVYYLSERGCPENLSRRERIAEAGIPVVDDIQGFDCYVDGLVGAAFRLPLYPEVEELIRKVNDIDALKIAVDIPSGLLFRADRTVVFTMHKKEAFLHGNRLSLGEYALYNPGFPEGELDSFPADSFLLEDSDYFVPAFSGSDYKNTRGHVAILGGSERYTGAAILAARSAFHAGAGLVTVFTGEKAYSALSSYRPAMVRKDAFDERGIKSLIVGPGWNDEGNRDFVSSSLPMVIDADGLEYIESGDRFGYRAVVTPHVGEFRRICSRLGIAEDTRVLSATLEVIVVLKAETVEITDGSSSYFYDGMNPSLGVAGSGDVLSGIIGAFLAAGMKPMDAAVNGVILHQKAGKAAHEKYGYYDTVDLVDVMGTLR